MDFVQDGGFYSAEDADSYPVAGAEQKKEGAFCVWTQEEIKSVLTEKLEQGSEKTIAELFCHHYGVGENGNVTPHQVGENTQTCASTVWYLQKEYGMECREAIMS